jgi:DNA polymerase III epsilon subunit-like protein
MLELKPINQGFFFDLETTGIDVGKDRIVEIFCIQNFIVGKV